MNKKNRRVFKFRLSTPKPQGIRQTFLDTKQSTLSKRFNSRIISKEMKILRFQISSKEMIEQNYYQPIKLALPCRSATSDP